LTTFRPCDGTSAFKLIHYTTPKTKAALRTITLFPESVAALKKHRAMQNAERLAVGEAWCDLDLVFATPMGGPHSPDTVYKNLIDIQRVANGQPKENRSGNRWRHMELPRIGGSSELCVM
jgi:hypothetical protein